MIRTETKGRLFQQIEEFLVSPSHDLGHLKRVASIGLTLQETHGGDPEVIMAASILHDLGRSEVKLIGKDSALESVRLARPILKEIGFSEEKIELVCQAIAEHDQADVRPTTIEGRILKEADFLDGFGARGILRSLLWSGERGENMEDIFHRFRVKMPKRIESLEFSESKSIARKQYYFVELFLSLLDQDPSLEREFLKGKYIIFEGISGSGKETQARKLLEELESRSIKARIVFEPTPDIKPVLIEWRKGVDDSLMELFLFVADRKRIMEGEILPALRAGEVVLGVRSKISTEVYQTETEYDLVFASFLQTFVPDPDLILWFDLSAEESVERILARSRKTGEARGKHEKMAKLKRHRSKYKMVLGRYENVVKIDAAPSIESIHKEIVRSMEEFDLV
jgi:uncharacterized protein